MVNQIKDTIRHKLSAREQHITDDEGSKHTAYEVPINDPDEEGIHVFEVEYAGNMWHSIYRKYDTEGEMSEETGYKSDTEKEAYKKLLRLVEEYQY